MVNSTDNATQPLLINDILYITPTGQEITFGYFQVCLLTIFIAGWIITLNTIVVHTLMVRKRQTEVTDYYVSALALTDGVTGLVLVYITTYSLLQYQVTVM